MFSLQQPPVPRIHVLLMLTIFFEILHLCPNSHPPTHPSSLPHSLPPFFPSFCFLPSFVLSLSLSFCFLILSLPPSCSIIVLAVGGLQGDISLSETTKDLSNLKAVPVFFFKFPFLYLNFVTFSRVLLLAIIS